MTLLLLLVTKPDMRQGAKKGLSNGVVSNKCQKQVLNDLTFVTIQVWMVLLLCRVGQSVESALIALAAIFFWLIARI